MPRLPALGGDGGRSVVGADQAVDAMLVDLGAGRSAAGGMTLEFELSWATPSNNQLLRMHWATRRKKTADLFWELQRVARRQRWQRPPDALVRVAIVRIGRKRLDRDNLYGGAKLLIDALIQSDLIDDDSEKDIDLTVEQEIGAPSRTRVLLEA